MGAVDDRLTIDEYSIAVKNNQLETSASHLTPYIRALAASVGPVEPATQSILDFFLRLVAGGGRRIRSGFFRKLFRHPEEGLSAIHFGPDLGNADPEFAP